MPFPESHAEAERKEERYLHHEHARALSGYFRSPLRRHVTRYSGYKASGEVSGKEAKVTRAERLNVDGGELILGFSKPVRVAPSFGRSIGVLGFGGYLYPRREVSITIELLYRHSGKLIATSREECSLEQNRWGKIGAHIILDLGRRSSTKGTLTANLAIRAVSGNVLHKIDFFGFDMGGVDYFSERSDFWSELSMKKKATIFPAFKKRTSLYLPEIYYFPSDVPFGTKPTGYRMLGFEKGNCVFLKGCNRCTRFLLLDLEHETNTLSFSNHCTSKKCTHSSFYDHVVVDCSCDSFPKSVMAKIEFKRGPSGKREAVKFRTKWGSQLECRPCKKFVVNAAHNPRRTASQHREDSLRRRALEPLVCDLLGRQSIYLKYKNTEKDFDSRIWEKFGKRCFKCHKSLSKPSGKDGMDVDHTLPLKFLWPLDESATCLCKACNSKKHDRFPGDFYSKLELRKLSRITNISVSKLRRKTVNPMALKALRGRVVWFFDSFLSHPYYQKVRDGKKASDLILKAIQDSISSSNLRVDLIEDYVMKTGHYPKSVTTSRRLVLSANPGSSRK
jgi:hypothetical protein